MPCRESLPLIDLDPPIMPGAHAEDDAPRRLAAACGWRVAAAER